MYFGADEPKKKEASTTPGWVGAVEPVGNVISNIVGSIYGNPPNQPPPEGSGSNVNWPIIAVAGLGVVVLGGVLLAKKK